MSSAQDFEKVLDESDTSVASFHDSHDPLRRIQHFLHSTPAAVPLIVLVMLIAFFAIAIGPKFF